MGLMVPSSRYMIILLFRHKQQSQCLHSKGFSPRSSPEKKSYSDDSAASELFCDHILCGLHNFIFHGHDMDK